MQRIGAIVAPRGRVRAVGAVAGAAAARSIGTAAIFGVIVAVVLDIAGIVSDAAGIAGGVVECGRAVLVEAVIVRATARGAIAVTARAAGAVPTRAATGLGAVLVVAGVVLDPASGVRAVGVA